MVADFTGLVSITRNNRKTGVNVVALDFKRLIFVSMLVKV